jgi:protein TonB
MSAPSAAPFSATTRSRLTSLSLVAGLHLLMILGLSAGLIRDALSPPPGPTQVRVVDDALPPPEPLPLPPTATPRVALPTPSLPLVPIPLIAVEASPTAISSQPLQPDAPPWREPQPAPPSVSTVAAASTPQSAGLLCPTQTRPQLPGLATEGSAHLRVIATVRAGRVVAAQLHTLQALPERRAQRALLAEVEQTLRSGYACTQDGVFEQEFLFRVE